jgi:hypothetical protein
MRGSCAARRLQTLTPLALTEATPAATECRCVWRDGRHAGGGTWGHGMTAVPKQYVRVWMCNTAAVWFVSIPNFVFTPG